MKELHELDDREMDRWIIHCRKSLASHASELKTSIRPGDIRAAMLGIITMVEEVADRRPSIRAKCLGLAARYRQIAAHG